MSIIFQVSAWVILAVGFFALGHKFFPNLKQWFSTGKISYVWLFAITFGLFLLLTYPYFFNWWAVNFWNVPESELSDFTKLGPLGDIYGSLNTLISSIALCAVAFSTLFQITSLNETRFSNEKQMNIAQKSHDEQLKESQHAIFSNAFYALLNVKENKFNSLEVIADGEILKGNDIFRKVASDFSKLSKNQWKGENIPSKKEIEFEFKIILDSEDDESVDIICSYFLIYGSMYNLIKNAKFLSPSENFYYKQLISNTMRIQEQITLCYISCFIERYQPFLKNSNIFGQFYDYDMSNLVKKYHNYSHFYGDSWKKVFDE
ncbi:MAG: hypothetical protein ACK410_01300 [Acinetobacter sp.]